MFSVTTLMPTSIDEVPVWFTAARNVTTIDLCLSLFEWAPFRTKAAVKVHTLLDLRGSIPAFIHVSDGRFHDIHVLDMLRLEPGAFYVVDRGYQDFSRFYAIHQAGAFFATRAKVRMDARRVYSMPTDRSTGVLCDQRVVHAGHYGAKHYPEQFRRIRLNDPDTGKRLPGPPAQIRTCGTTAYGSFLES
jgi:Transposase DDE domain